MPRGVPKAGFRNRGSDIERLAAIKVQYNKPTVVETEEQIELRLAERFEILDVLTEACIVGNSRALIVSGAPGIGKSFGVEKILKDHDPSGESYEIVRGYTRATGLIKLLYRYRHDGNIIVFDDADSAVNDDIALNLLKAVADTTDRRIVSWLSEGTLIDEETAERVPRSFEFNGSVIFLTNLDFEGMVNKNHKLSPHLQALMSRSHYLDLSMKSKKDYLVRIRQVLKQGMLSNLSFSERSDVITFIEKNYEQMRELSLRACVKLGSLRKSSDRWESIARVTMLK